MAKKVDLRKLLRKPSGKKIDGQRKAIHFHKKGNDERGEGAEGSPVPLRLRFKKTEREKNENEGVDDYQTP